jgi:hypothetical protein
MPPRWDLWELRGSIDSTVVRLVYQSLSIADNSKATQQQPEHNHF